MKKLNIYAFFALVLSLAIVFSGCVSSIDEGVSVDLSSTASDNEPSVGGTESNETDAEESDTSDDDSSSPSDISNVDGESSDPSEKDNGTTDPLRFIDINNLPVYDGSPFAALNGNEPSFGADEITDKAFENYAKLDKYGRCGTTFACVGRETMPTEPRGDISSVKPSGWNNVKYDASLVDGGYIYNRCHLLGFQLTGENANEKNLITGTRYMNVDGMLPFENMVADYIKETGNHVILRVTPVFVGNELVARGVVMEAYSVEDEGDGIYYNVYCFNVQPGIDIDYATGESKLGAQNGNNDSNASGITYVLNTNTKKFHYPDCASAKKISDKNREETDKTREELIAMGYSPCGNCDP